MTQDEFNHNVLTLIKKMAEETISYWPTDEGMIEVRDSIQRLQEQLPVKASDP